MMRQIENGVRAERTDVCRLLEEHAKELEKAEGYTGKFLAADWRMMITKIQARPL